METEKSEPKSQPESLSEIMTRKSAEEVQAGVPPAPVIMPQKTEPAPTRQYSALPEVEQEMSLSEVQMQIDTFLSNVSADRNHPYLRKGHPLNKSYRKHLNSLYELKSTMINPVTADDWLLEAQEKQEAAHQKLIDDAQNDMDAIVATGKYNRSRIPDDLTASRAKLLKIQRYFAEDNIAMARNLLRASYNELKVPLEVQEAFLTLGEATEKAEIQFHTDNIIRWLDRKYKSLEEKQRKPKREIDKRPNYLKKTGRGDFTL